MIEWLKEKYQLIFKDEKESIKRDYDAANFDKWGETYYEKLLKDGKLIFQTLIKENEDNWIVKIDRIEIHRIENSLKQVHPDSFHLVAYVALCDGELIGEPFASRKDEETLESFKNWFKNLQLTISKKVSNA